MVQMWVQRSCVHVLPTFPQTAVHSAPWNADLADASGAVKLAQMALPSHCDGSAMARALAQVGLRTSTVHGQTCTVTTISDHVVAWSDLCLAAVLRGAQRARQAH